MVSSKGRPRSEVGVQLPPGIPVAAQPLTDRLAVVGRPAVNRLLREQPELAGIVRQAADQLATFIPDARLKLELLTDPDYGEGEQLFLGVATDMHESDALEALRRFDSEWWLRNIPRARGLLCIDLSDG